MRATAWPVRALQAHPHRHPKRNLWVDDDDKLWRCDRKNCTWTRPYEDWEECVTYGLLHDGHAGPLVRSIAPSVADLVCPQCGAMACKILLRPQGCQMKHDCRADPEKCEPTGIRRSVPLGRSVGTACSHRESEDAE